MSRPPPLHVSLASGPSTKRVFNLICACVSLLHMCRQGRGSVICGVDCRCIAWHARAQLGARGHRPDWVVRLTWRLLHRVCVSGHAPGGIVPGMSTDMHHVISECSKACS
eukprot:365350-Chlamydomonas_euryale.AAC.3